MNVVFLLIFWMNSRLLWNFVNEFTLVGGKFYVFFFRICDLQIDYVIPELMSLIET